MTSNKGRVHFFLAGYNFNPDEITQTLDIEPTSTQNAGAHSHSDRPAISSWELSSDMAADEIDIYKMTDELIKIIEPKKDQVLTLIERFNLAPRINVSLLLSIDKEESSPDVGFGSRTVRFLSEIGAFINIDYKLSERI